MKMLPDSGSKLGAFPQRHQFMRTSWTRGQSLGWWCPMSWGRRPASQASIREDSGYSTWPRGTSWALPAVTFMGHRWSCPATSWPPLPQLWEPTLGAHGATNQLFSSSFPSLSCLLYPKGISLQSRCDVALLFSHKTKVLYFLFHFAQHSFFLILYSSFTWTFPCAKPWLLTFPLVSATSSWSLRLALPLGWDRIHAWYFHSCYIRRRQPLYWGLASTQWSSARPAA